MENNYYWNMVDRNLGILGEANQQKLKDTTLPVFGVGALGSIAAEILVRSGVGGLRIVDIDEYEASNLNRQLHCFSSTIGTKKVDATKKFLLDINPELRLEVFHETSDETISAMLKDTPVALMCIDDIVPSIHVARRCTEQNIPMVESVAMPFLNVRVFGEQTVTFEQFYGFETEEKSMEALYKLSPSEQEELVTRFIATFAGIDNLMSYYSQGGVDRMKAGNFSTFAPMVWMQSSAIALETIKLLLDWGTISYAPDYAIYDPFTLSMLDPK